MWDSVLCIYMVGQFVLMSLSGLHSCVDSARSIICCKGSYVSSIFLCVASKTFVCLECVLFMGYCVGLVE